MFTRPWEIAPVYIRPAAKEDYIRPQWCTALDTEHIIGLAPASH
jgi:hypothetical protein